jgi:hypothetical protein
MAGALTWLLRAAEPQPWTRLVPALADRLGDTARAAPSLPPDLLDAIFAAGIPVLIDEICRGMEAATTPQDGLRHRLATSGHVLRYARFVAWPLRDRRAYWAGARADDPAWTAPRGPVAEMLASTDVQRLRAVVGGPFPDLVRHALRTGAARMTRAEQLRGLLSIVTAAGPAAIADLGPALSPPVADALGGDLARLVAEAEGTAGVMEILRDHPDPDQLTLWRELDWDAILAAHHAEPIGANLAAALAARPDCPDPVRLALYATHPLAVAGAGRPTPALLAAPLPARGAVGVAKRLAADAIRAGLPADSLLRAALAPVMLEALHRQRVVPDELRALVAGRLGADVTRWTLVRATLKGHRGSIVGLLSDVTGTPPPGWPDPQPAPALAERETVTGVRAAFLSLLDAAPVDAHLALFDHLDDRTIHDLLSRGRWRDEWVEVAVASRNPVPRRSLSTRRDLDVAVLDRLAACADPAVDDQLFRADNLSWTLRTTILRRPVLHPALKSHLLGYVGGSGLSPYHARDAIDSPDLDLQLHIPRYRLIYGETPQLRLVLNVWQRHGRAAVEKLLAVTDGPSTFQGRLLSAGTITRVRRYLEDDAPDRLEDEVTRGEAAAVQIAVLRAASGPTSPRMRDCHDWNWAAIHDEHVVRPFRDEILEALSSRPGCPEWFSTAYGTPFLSGLSRGEQPADLLARIDVDAHAMLWLIAHGKLAWADLFAHGRPAPQVFRTLDAAKGQDQRDGLAALRALVGSTLGRHPEAWVLAAHMADDFAGSVAELLFTAAAATG